MSKKPELSLVQGDKPVDLGNLARLAAYESMQEDRDLIEEMNRNDRTLDDVNRVIGELTDDQKQRALEKLAPNIDPLLQRKDEILSRPGVLKTLSDGESEYELSCIFEIVNDIENTQRWDLLNALVQEAVEKGYFRIPQRNERGNINFRSLKFPKNPSDELFSALRALKGAIMDKVKELAKGQKGLRKKPKSKK